MDNARVFQVRVINERTNQRYRTKPDRSRSITLEPMTNGDCYRISVRAYANNAWRGWSTLRVTPGGSSSTGTSTGGSNAVNGFTNGSGACNAPFVGGSPTQPKPVATSGASSISVSWPKVDNAKEYRVRLKDLSTGDRRVKRLSSQRFTFDRLSEGTCYEVSVRAFVDGKWQRWSTLEASPTG